MGFASLSQNKKGNRLNMSLRIPSLLFVLMTFFACNNVQSQTGDVFAAKVFYKKIQATPSAIVLDVRTPEEYQSGHLPDAINIDWNGEGFEKQVSTLDKSKPVFVYCHSGRRSTAAANQMRKNGFSKVYELEGGIVGWNEAGLPVSK